MIKKIKIVSKGVGTAYGYTLGDTTIGKVYDAHFWESGDVDNEGVRVDKPALSFVDDVGDVVGLYLGNPEYEVVEEVNQ